MEKDKDLSELNTFGLACTAHNFLEIKSETEAEEIFDGLSKDQEWLILGGGSNVLFVNDFDGLILANRIMGKDKVREDDEHVWLRIGAGEIWHDVVRHCLSKNWGGIENLSLIPGCSGAAPIQNIGAYGVEIKDVIDSVSAIVYPEKELRIFDNEACEFGYRDSVFKRELKGKICVTYIVLKLNKTHVLNTKYGAIREELANKPEEEWSIHDVSEAVIRIRQSKLPDPKELGNAGSFFKNPTITQRKFELLAAKHPNIRGFVLPNGRVKVAAGWLIEACGWKGKRVGNTGCHASQALVLVNYGRAIGEEIVQHAERVMDSVKNTFGIQLEAEVNIIR